MQPRNDDQDTCEVGRRREQGDSLGAAMERFDERDRAEYNEDRRRREPNRRVPYGRGQRVREREAQTDGDSGEAGGNRDFARHSCEAVRAESLEICGNEQQQGGGRDGKGAEFLRWLQPASQRHRGGCGESRRDPETQRLAGVDRHPGGAGGRHGREHGSERRVVVCGRHHDDRAREPRDRPDVREHV